MIVMDHLGALDQTLMRLEGLIAPPIDTDGFYGLHPLPAGEFFAGLDVCRSHLAPDPSVWPGGSFIDVGCGIGTKMLLASYHGWTVAGVESDPRLAQLARQLTGESVWCGDAFADWDLTGYDVVYSYRLCVDLDRQHELEKHLVGRMRRGALLFVAGSIAESLRRVGDQVWEVD